MPNAVPLQLGKHVISPPVVLAPMAGVTNYPFRKLCHQLGAPLTVSEMVTVRPLVEKLQRTQKIAHFGADEKIRSIQLYGVDPYYMSEAVKRLVGEGAVEHIDLNFGCPMKKVTSKGGGAALPYKRKLYQQLVNAAVCNSQDVPVTVKLRLGIDAEHLTFLESATIAADEGIAAIGLHARTAAQLYSGHADWSCIAELKNKITSVPILGNGDIFSADDAVRMMQTTGCDGVIIGRGCLGQPWLFRELVKRLIQHKPYASTIYLGEASKLIKKHLRYMLDWFGDYEGIRSFRKHLNWYTKGFSAMQAIKKHLLMAETESEIVQLLEQLPKEALYIAPSNWAHNEKARHPQSVSVPYGYYDDPDEITIPSDDSCGEGG